MKTNLLNGLIRKLMLSVNSLSIFISLYLSQFIVGKFGQPLLIYRFAQLVFYEMLPD